MDFLELTKKGVGVIENTNSTIQLVTHNDADGISSAAILIYSLMYLNKSFQLSTVKKVSSKLIDDVIERDPELVIFTDLGSSYPDEVNKLKCKVIILDHHDVKEDFPDNILHINPELFGISQLSGSGVTYLFTQEILKNKLLAPIALVGTIGDSAESVDIFHDSHAIERERGLELFGRFSRPIHTALQYSSTLPHLSNESKAIQFLSETGIKLKQDGEWRTIGDLNNEEYQKLCDSLIKEQLKHGGNIEKLFGDVWTLKNFPQQIQDVKEFATLLNGCGRMNEAAVGVAICLGSKKALEKSRLVKDAYRRMIRKSMKWLEENPDAIKHSKYAMYIMAGHAINENLIGTVVSMCFNDQGGKPIFGFSNAEDEIKISARASDIDINKIINVAAESVEGTSGGHYQAAGARIPLGTEDKFIEKCNELLEKAL